MGQDGYLSETLGGSITSYSQNITSNPTNYNDSLGNMKIRFTVTATTSTPFKINVDSSTFTPGSANYAVHLEEQWINLNYNNASSPRLMHRHRGIRQGNLAVDAWFNWRMATDHVRAYKRLEQHIRQLLLSIRLNQLHHKIPKHKRQLAEQLASGRCAFKTRI